MNQIENILCDIDGLIGAALDAGDKENARALVEEFGEWFLDYESGKKIDVLLSIDTTGVADTEN